MSLGQIDGIGDLMLRTDIADQGQPLELVGQYLRRRESRSKTDSCRGRSGAGDAAPISPAPVTSRLPRHLTEEMCHHSTRIAIPGRTL